MMGLLDYIKANTPRNTRKPVSVSKVINEGLLNPNQYNAPAANRLKDSAFGLLGLVPGAGDVAAGAEAADLWNRGEKLGAGLSALGTLPLIPAIGAHVVYHGSPHKFDAFDMSKIGTGEGAQAYGHGLYFAESPEVAKDYMRLGHLRLGNPTVKGEDIFSASNRLAIEGKPELGDTLRDFNHFLNEADNSSKVISRKADKQAMLEQFKARTQQEAQQAGDQYAGFYADRLKNIDFLEQNLDPLPASSFYKVDIPDEVIPRMLDWEKTLDQQNPEVQAALGKLGINSPWEVVSDTGHALPATYKTAEEANQILAKIGAGTVRQRPGTWRGDSAYKFISDAGPESAALRLKEAGIPGIRYLDGNSRGAGGTSNFVLFDDELARILEINGQPTGLLPWAEEAARKKK